MEERRRSKRYVMKSGRAVLPLPVAVQVLDIGVGGALLQSNRPINVGTRGSLRLNVGGTPFTADLEVRRLSTGSPATGYQIGTIFVDISPEDRDVIEHFTND